MDKQKVDKGAETKRSMISKDSQSVMIASCVSAVVIAVSLVLGGSMIEDITYNGKVIAKLTDTSSKLESNRLATTKIETALNVLNKDSTLKQLSITTISGNQQALQVVLDAMPTNDDRATLAASIHKLFTRSGASLQSLNVNDGQSSSNANANKKKGTTTKTSTGPKQISFDVSIMGSVAVIQNTLKDVERSIRPISITKMSIASPDANELKVEISATTYYNPLTTYEITEEVVTR